MGLNFCVRSSPLREVVKCLWRGPSVAFGVGDREMRRICKGNEVFRSVQSGATQRGEWVSKSVSWCFEPSQPQRITSGLNTNFTLSPGHSFHQSSYHESCFFFFFSLFIFPGHSTREPAPSRGTYFILRAYTGTGASHSQHTLSWNKRHVCSVVVFLLYPPYHHHSLTDLFITMPVTSSVTIFTTTLAVHSLFLRMTAKLHVSSAVSLHVAPDFSLGCACPFAVRTARLVS